MLNVGPVSRMDRDNPEALVHVKSKAPLLISLPRCRMYSNVSHLAGNVHEAQEALLVAGHA